MGSEMRRIYPHNLNKVFGSKFQKVSNYDKNQKKTNGYNKYCDYTNQDEGTSKTV